MAEYFEYIPTEWKAGDIVTSAKLNKIEEALKNLVLYVHINVTYEEITGKEIYTLDKTWAEIYAAPMVFLVDDEGKYPLYIIYTTSEDNVMYYNVEFEDSEAFSCSSENEYPSYKNINQSPSIDPEFDDK